MRKYIYMTTLEFARKELNRYLIAMTGQAGDIRLTVSVDDEPFKERCDVSVRGGKGEFNANCSRALLLGVYDFLRVCGCRFLRPGKKGEVVPKLSLEEVNAEYTFAPTQRHRGITIEGAVSVENILELIDWAPKVGFNSYFTQFTTSFEFFDRWYSHGSNPFLAEENIDEETAKSYIKRIVEAIKQRDMLYHAVGHGWTTGCLGLTCNGWEECEQTLPEEKRSLLAEMNGVRGFFKGRPLNTHLCYSNPEARRLLAEEVVGYAEEHSEVDVLHFWLADDSNNACECAECAKKRMADWYVMILNDIDRMLTEKGIKTKIVFLVYLELFWPPLETRINNPDRFLMMFAPIFRSYTKAYDLDSDWQTHPLLPYEKNKMTYPCDAETYLAFFAAWKKIFSGDSFAFEYHLMWDINRDFGGEMLAKVIYDDVRSLPKIGLNGFISCQLQRAFYPNGLNFYLLGRALTDEKLSFETICKEYYDAAFGEHAAFARQYYTEIERTVSFPYMREEVSGMEALPGLLKAQTFIEKTLTNFPEEEKNAVNAESLDILRFAAENTLRLVNVLVLKLQGATEKSIEEADKERKDFFNRNEMRFQPYADGFYVNMITNGLIEAEKTGLYATKIKKMN